MAPVPYLRNPLMKGFTEDYFETNDHVKLRILHKGEGDILILVHGGVDYADCWLLNAPELSETFSVYALDLRGHGYSFADHGAHIHRMGADLNEFINSLGADKVNLLGWSMGCTVIWSYIEMFGQDKIRRLILDDEPPILLANPTYTRDDIMRTGSNRMDFWLMVNALAKYGDEPDPEGRMFGGSFSMCFDRGAKLYTEEELKAFPDGYYEKMKQKPAPPPMNKPFQAQLMRDHLTNDWSDVIPTIRVPTLLLTGDNSHATTLECSQWMVDQIPGCEWVRFSTEEGGWHSFCQTAYKKFNRVVREFLLKDMQT